MMGTQRPDSPGRESMVARLDRRLYEQALEWAQAEGIPIRAVLDAVLWHYFLSVHPCDSLRRLVKQRAAAIADSIRSTGKSRAETMLPRWRKPQVKAPALPSIPLPPPPKPDA
jgi:hypothetical protein